MATSFQPSFFSSTTSLFPQSAGNYAIIRNQRAFHCDPDSLIPKPYKHDSQVDESEFYSIYVGYAPYTEPPSNPSLGIVFSTFHYLQEKITSNLSHMDSSVQPSSYSKFGILTSKLRLWYHRNFGGKSKL